MATHINNASARMSSSLFLECSAVRSAKRMMSSYGLRRQIIISIRIRKHVFIHWSYYWLDG